MAHFVVNDEDRLERITLPDGEWVDVLGALSLYERKRLLGAAYANIRARNDGNVDVSELAFAEAAFAGLKLGIKAWSFEDENGAPIPVTVEQIKRLDDFTGEFISMELDRMWSRRSDEESKNSGTAGQPTSAGEKSPKSSAG